MTRFCLVATLVACAFSPLTSAIEGASPTPDEFVERTKVKLEKLQHLIRAHQDMENAFIDQQKHLKETYGDVEFTNVYQGINLATMDGIRTARERLKRLNARNEGFAVAQKQSRTTWEDRARNADVDEPLRSELNASFSTVEPNIAAKYAAWFDARRDTSAAIARLFVDTAQRHLGKLEWHDGQLIATDKRASIDLLAAQKALADTEHRYNVTGRAALGTRDPTPQFIGAALQELEKTMAWRDGK
jgi:hypothetical protein